MRNVSNKICREYQNTHFILTNFFSKILPFVRYLEKCCWAGKATDNNIIWRMRIACKLPKATNTLIIYTTYCFSTATMIERMCPNVTLYLHRLSCLTMQMHVYDKISQCCVFLCRMLPWRWPKKAEACTRISVWLYSSLSNCCAVVGINCTEHG